MPFFTCFEDFLSIVFDALANLRKITPTKQDLCPFFRSFVRRGLSDIQF
jgi:hypothetical protein